MIPRRKLPLYGLVLAYGISQLGTLMSGLAIPWLVLVTTGSAARTGLVGFAEMAPYVVAQAISGPVVDRFGLRRSCVTGNAAAAVLVGAVPALYAAGALSIGSLFAIVAVAGAVRGAADAATSPLVPRTAAYGGVPNERAAGLNSVAQRTGMLVGLPLAGVLIAVAGAPTVVLVDAVTFAAAALLVAAAVPVAATKADDDAAAAASGQLTVRGYLSRLGDGMRFIRADRVIAGIALMVAVANLLDVALDSVFIPVWVHTRLHRAVRARAHRRRPGARLGGRRARRHLAGPADAEVPHLRGRFPARRLPSIHRACLLLRAAARDGRRGARRPGGRRAEPDHRGGRLRARPRPAAGERPWRVQGQRVDRDPVRRAARRSADRVDRPARRAARDRGGDVPHDARAVRVPLLAGHEPAAAAAAPSGEPAAVAH